MQLLINTSEKDEIIISLLDKGHVKVEKRFEARYRQAELLLIEIDELLAANYINLDSIDSIIVENRGDSFTALRIGVVTANALGYALQIPVMKKSRISTEIPRKRTNAYDIVQPEYSKEPNITQKKS
jgi:tRNA A37 threonylcarbamoyladenosine modification protein TsaB